MLSPSEESAPEGSRRVTAQPTLSGALATFIFHLASPFTCGRNALKASGGVSVSLAALVSLVLMTGCEWGSIGFNKGYAPEQPVPFSHELHAGQYKIQCLYCHSGVERSGHSPVPSLNTCMNCHLVVATDKANIQKISAAYNAKQPIPWVKVHMLPDHVKFNHKAHVQKFGAPQSCHKCHGPVESMEVLYQNSPLSMGWCVNCHRQPEHQAPINCSTCHY